MWHLLCGFCGNRVAGRVVFVVITDTYPCHSHVTYCDNHVALLKPVEEPADPLGIPVNLVGQSSETGNKRAARYQNPHPIYKGGGVFPRGPFNYGDPKDTLVIVTQGFVVHPAPMHFDVADVSHSPL